MQVVDQSNEKHHLKNASHRTKLSKSSAKKMQIIDLKKCKPSNKIIQVIDLKSHHPKNSIHRPKKCRLSTKKIQAIVPKKFKSFVYINSYWLNEKTVLELLIPCLDRHKPTSPFYYPILIFFFASLIKS